jgi:hypothetical protein
MADLRKAKNFNQFMQIFSREVQQQQYQAADEDEELLAVESAAAASSSSSSSSSSNPRRRKRRIVTSDEDEEEQEVISAATAAPKRSRKQVQPKKRVSAVPDDVVGHEAAEDEDVDEAEADIPVIKSKKRLVKGSKVRGNKAQ